MSSGIIEILKEQRPNLSVSSLKTYASILKNLYSKLYNTDDFNKTKLNDDVEHVLHYLTDAPANKRKTILSALVVLTSNEKYREQMMKDVSNYNKEIKNNEKTETQQNAWVTATEIGDLTKTLKKNADKAYRKETLNMDDLQDIQKYIMLVLLGGEFIAPRRSMDWCDFKIKDINKEKDNYISGKTFIFNSYKTSKAYGEQQIAIPPPLMKILNKWISKNPTDYLLFDTNYNKLSSVKMTQRLNKLFGKKTSINALRHTYLTDKFGDTLQQKKKIEETMHEMGSSPEMLDTYVKH